MIDHVLTFLKDQLNSYLKVKTGVEGFEVVFVQERTPREITLPKEALSALLVNLEEERTFRSGAAYQHQRDITSLPNKTLLPHLLYLNLYVLFVANFTNYSQSLKLLSLVISFFHSHRLFESQNSPALSSDIQKLTLELVNLPKWMLSMNYQGLFELSIIHDYYHNKVCTDLNIEPTSECRKILARHRLLVKNKVNGIQVIVPVTETGKPLAIKRLLESAYPA